LSLRYASCGRRAGKGYVLGVTGDHLFQSWDKPRPVARSAAAIAGTLQPSDWHRLSAGAGTKGPDGSKLIDAPPARLGLEATRAAGWASQVGYQNERISRRA